MEVVAAFMRGRRPHTSLTYSLFIIYVPLPPRGATVEIGMREMDSSKEGRSGRVSGVSVSTIGGGRERGVVT